MKACVYASVKCFVNGAKHVLSRLFAEGNPEMACPLESPFCPAPVRERYVPVNTQVLNCVLRAVRGLGDRNRERAG